MKEKTEKKTRGVYENPPGSGVWWTNYYISGKRHREKVGPKAAAIKLYQKRKTDARVGRKLPELRPGTAVTLAHLMADGVAYAKLHNATFSDYETKERLINETDLGSRPANDITPKELESWISKHCKTASTANRYRSFFSLCFREGQANGKADSNPARLVRLRKEGGGRLRYLTRAEYDKVVAIINRDNPSQLPSFIASVFTGMRRGEQFSLTWSQVDIKRRVIRLTKTKNGSARNVPLNSAALAAFESQMTLVAHRPGDLVFPRPGPSADHRWWLGPALKEAEITGFVWHCIRHTFCSWLAMAGVSIKEIQVLAGHKSITMSARYAHLAPEVAVSASERLVLPITTA